MRSARRRPSRGARSTAASEAANSRWRRSSASSTGCISGRRTGVVGRVTRWIVPRITTMRTRLAVLQPCAELLAGRTREPRPQGRGRGRAGSGPGGRRGRSTAATDRSPVRSSRSWRARVARLRARSLSTSTAIGTGLGLGGRSVVELGQSDGQGPERPAAVADGVLLVGGHLGERAAVAVVGDEHAGRSRSRPRRRRSAAIGPRRRPRPTTSRAVGPAHQRHGAEPGPARPAARAPTRSSSASSLATLSS